MYICELPYVNVSVSTYSSVKSCIFHSFTLYIPLSKYKDVARKLFYFSEKPPEKKQKKKPKIPKNILPKKKPRF